MDNHSKNVCLIGVLHIMGYILFSVEPITRAIHILNRNENAEEPNNSEPIFLLGLAGTYLVLVILASLMLFGVVKKRHLLMAPFVIIFSLILGVTIILFSMHLLIEFNVSLYYIKDFLYTIGVQIVSLYPIYTLFLKLRLRSLKEKSLNESSDINEKERIY